MLSSDHRLGCRLLEVFFDGIVGRGKHCVLETFCDLVGQVVLLKGRQIIGLLWFFWNSPDKLRFCVAGRAWSRLFYTYDDVRTEQRELWSPVEHSNKSFT